MEGEHGDFSIYKNRVIFPIKNALGQISGFGSRRLDKEKKNKYINSPQSAVFNKSELLYSTPCKPKGIAVITEGYMDVISCSQNDDSNTYYAALGVALNSGNVREVLRKHERVVICADGDSAGIKATQKFIKNNLHNLDVNRIGFVILDEGMDPDDFIKKNGITSFIEKLESPLSAKDFIDLSLDNNEGLQALESYDQYRL
jgi:DNA primase